MTLRPYLARLCALGLIALPLVAGATEYVLIKPLPFIGEKAGNLGEYLKNIFRLALGLAITLAVFMLVINGIRYMTSDIIGEKTKAKQGLWDAVIGLMIIFGSVLILTTINPRLTEFHLQETINRTVQAIKDGRPADAKPVVPPPGGSGCPTCALAPGVKCKNQNTCQVDSRLVPKIQALNSNLQGKLDWQITEGYSATGHAAGSCHETGTCFDANIIGSRTPQNITTFITAAGSAGLRATYEVGDATTRNFLIEAGVPAGNVSVNTSSNYTGPHFHVTGG